MSERMPTANQLYFGELPEEPAYVEAMEHVFFRSVLLPNGTRKTTSHLWRSFSTSRSSAGRKYSR